MSKNNKTQRGYPEEIKRKWENEDCVNYAIGLSRLTGWLLTVSWWEDETWNKEDRKSLRVYVADNGDGIYDVRGAFTVYDYPEKILMPILRQRFTQGKGEISEDFYLEEILWRQKLRIRPNEEKVLEAMELIKKHPALLEKIPRRKEPNIPAGYAGKYTFGNCAIYAEAMRDLTGLSITAIVAKKFKPDHGGHLGYAHSVIVHPGDVFEDAWGKQSLEEIISRYYIQEFELSQEAHINFIDKIKANNLDIYSNSYKEAVSLIQRYVLNK